MDLDDAELETQLRDALTRAAEPVHGEGIFRETIHNEVARRQATRRRNRWTTRLTVGAAIAAAAAVSVLVLTRPDQDRVDIDDNVADTPTTEATPETTTPSTTAPPVDDGAGAPVETTTTAPSTTTTPPLPAFPPEDPLGHGKSTWGVYLVVMPAGQASVDSPEFQVAQQAAIDAGYSQGEGYSGIGCDEGAEEALGVDPEAEWISPAVYFATEEQANQARAAFEARGQSVDGIAHVNTYCLD